MKRVARGLAGLLAFLLALAVAGVWMAATAGGFRWLTGAVTTLSGERVKFEGVEGHLGVPLAIGKLTLASERQRVEIAGLRLEWQPRALWQRRVEVDLLAARSVWLEILKEDPTPPEFPRSLRPPLDLHIRVLDLARLEVLTAGQTFSFRNLRATLDGRGDNYRLSQAGATTAWADLSGEIDLAKDAPFALRGAFSAVRREALPARAGLQLGGTLAALEFKLDAAAEGMRFMASGVAAPFAEVRLTRLLLAGEGIDPRKFIANAPSADLAFSGVFEGQPGERLLGTFSLSNRLAGRLDQNRLPLANFIGAVLGDGTRADFSALTIDLGTAGQLTGAGQWRDGRMALNLASPSLNLAGLHRGLSDTRLRTTLRLTGDAARQVLSGETVESWGRGRFALAHADAALRLEEADFSGQAGRLTAKGVLRLDASRAFSAEFDATRINPARFGKFPRARLNARGQASGTLLPEPRLETRFSLPPGELEGRPVKGQGYLRYENRHLADADIDLNLAGNLARFKGSLGRAGDRLIWDIDAPALARLNLGLAGRLTSSGSVSGEFTLTRGQPRIEAVLAASNLRLPGEFSADTLNLKLDIQATPTGAFNGQLDARGITVSGQRLSALLASARGRRDAHMLEFDARMPDWRLSAGLAGGLARGNDAAQAWRGQLSRAELQGPWPMSLIAPADLMLSAARQEVGNLALNLAGGRVTVEQFSRQGTRMASRGRLGNLPLAPLLPPLLALLKTTPPFTTDLRADGDWNLRIGDSLDGQVRLSRHSGDVRMKEPAMALGLTTLTLDLDAEASRVTARVEAVSRDAGKLSGEGRATVLREGAFFALPRGAPLAWTAQFDLPDLRLLKPFIPLGIRADARLDAQISGSGSLAAPRIEGRIAAGAIRFAMPEQGIQITDGMLKLLLAEDRVRVQEGVLKGSSGRVALSGEAQLKNPQAGLTLVFEKFAASNRSDRRVTVSGTTRLNFDRKRLQLTGELRADRARLEMPEASRPTLSSDVVVVGQSPREQTVSQRYPLALDLKLDLGGDFLFKGAGLDARLGGQLRVFTADETLRGEGRIRVEEGRYAAYAQSLVIERGVLSFVGPIDNPGLDVLAVRKTATVKAGVQVRGTVRRPLVTLYSDPPLPDTEKLSWLVLGHGLDKGGRQEFALLQIAAGALLSRSESANFQAQLADALHIDSFDVRGGEGEDLSSSVVSVGKRLSSRAMLSYEQSLDGLNQVVKVLYQLSPRVRLEAQTGQQSSIDAFYSVEYD